MRIISRSEWGFRGWAGATSAVPRHIRRYFVVHYHGGPTKVQYGPAVPRNVDSIHRANGWAGIGYNFAVDLAGEIYEGRGWDLRGSHCPPRNRDGLGVYVAVGDGQRPTPAALAAVCDLYDLACRLTGRRLTRGVHSDWYATSCAGSILTPWVHSGMPRPTPSRGGPATAALTDPPPDPSPTPERTDPMATLMRVHPHATVYLTDGITARPIATERELRDIYQLSNEGVLHIRWPDRTTPGVETVGGLPVRVVTDPALIGRVVGEGA